MGYTIEHLGESQMPWQECNRMDERLRFVARLLDGDKMAAVCREFSISRKTGYKIFNRYKDIGIQGLEDKARRPYRHANKLPFQIEKAIVKIKRVQNWHNSLILMLIFGICVVSNI